MKPLNISQVRHPMMRSTGRLKNQPEAKRAVFSFIALMLLFAASSVLAQIQPASFNVTQVRITVPINSTNSTAITNIVNVPGPDPANFSVTGLPAGAAATLTDTNGNPLLSSTIDTNLVLTVNTTNIAEGVYSFQLNATSPTATNFIVFVIQAAHIWNGNLNVSNNWTEASAWLGGVPTATSDVVFGDKGAQTNFTGGIAFTNVGIDANVTIASLRFMQTGETNSVATNSRPRFHTIRIAPSTTLTITGTNGFTFLRDYIDDSFTNLVSMGVSMVGGTSSRLVVSNNNANFALLVGNQSFGSTFGDKSFLNISNVNNFVAVVNRMGLADYRLFPNYRNYNDVNDLGDAPSQFMVDVALARTNIITAIYKDPENYTNEFTRNYAFSLGNNEVDGNGSSINGFLYLGQSNAFFMDSVLLGGANWAIGNAGSVRFNPAFPNSTAIFRSTNNARMSVFSISDTGGTNRATDTTRMNTVDFANGNGLVDILVDRFYMSRDRTLIASNQNPVVESQLTFGRGTIDANTAVLGFQEHSGKDDWTTIGGAEAYRNYCRADLIVTNGGLFKVNGTMTLGYTADNNPVGSAQQFNTRGTVTVYANSTVAVSNVVVDGGLNFYDSSGRNNRLTINSGGTFIVTNSIGDAPGLPLDTLAMENGTLVFQTISPTRTNAFVRALITSGTSPSIIKVNALSGVTTYPIQIPVISYDSASSPFLSANVSALGAGFSAYVLDNVANKTVDLFITTNPPNSLIWRGLLNNNWDTTTKNWITTVGSFPTNFSTGDSVTFDDGTANTGVNIVGTVVPGQSGTGVTVNSTVQNYSFSGGTVAGTALLAKNGSSTLTLNTVKQGPININAGTVTGSGSIGLANVASNAVLNYSGFINGGLTSTGTVTIASGGSLVGPMTIRGGVFVNSGTVSNTATALNVTGRTLMTNTASGLMYMIAGNWSVADGSTLANFGTIYNTGGRLNLGSAAAPFDGGLLFGTGEIQDPDGTPLVPPFNAVGADGRITINNAAVISPGAQPYNSIGTMSAKVRFDFNNNLAAPPAQIRIEVDFSQSPGQINDIIIADRWNNIAGMLVMTNINPGAGSFTNGQVFQVFQNANGINFPNQLDVNGTYPVMSPSIPGPGLQWGLADFRTYGTISVTNTPLIWNGTGSGTWDTNGSLNNWKSGLVYSDSQGAMFDDSAVGTTTVSLTNVVAPIGFILTTNISGGVTNIFTNSPVLSPGLVFSNTARDYTIGGTGRISGMTGLMKTGSGTLSILTSNDFTGSVFIEGGTVAITNVAGLGATLSGANSSQAYINAATLNYTGNTNANLGRAIVINGGGATLNVASATNELTIGTAIVGAGALTKTGPGTLLLNTTGSSYTNTIIGSGPLRLLNAGAGYGSITLPNSSAILQLTNSFTFTNTINVTGSGTTIRVLSNSLPVSGGVWTGNGDVTISNGSVFVFNAPLSGFNGTISFGNSIGTFRFNNVTNNNPCLGGAAATFDLGTGTASLSNMNGAALTYDLGALTGGANTILAGRASNAVTWAANTTYSIGANGSNTTFSGRILNGFDTVAVNKVGSGKLQLNGANGYTGLTTVSAGALGGTGSIAGPVTVTGGGTLSPGASIGTLAISNSLTLNGTVSVEVSRNGGTLTSDKIVGLTSVAYGGTLAVTNVGPDALAQGHSFQLFNIGGTGNFTNIVPALAPPLSWSFNPVTGVLSVAGPAPTLNVNQVGNTLQFSWTNTGTNLFKLQAQTNTLSVGVSSNWGYYPGGGTSPVSVTINPANPTVFFRLGN